ncbi:hypothetical protein GS470_25070 [Rhodococcus hoagii]|nr:hypothetical protein [Prescottella equi]
MTNIAEVASRPDVILAMAEALAEKFSHGDTADAIAERLSCCEVDASPSSSAPPDTTVPPTAGSNATHPETTKATATTSETPTPDPRPGPDATAPGPGRRSAVPRRTVTSEPTASAQHHRAGLRPALPAPSTREQLSHAATRNVAYDTGIIPG